MKVRVLVRPGRKHEFLKWDGEQFVAEVKAPPVDGAANKRLIELLAEKLLLAKSQVTIIKGFTSRHKTLEIQIEPARFQDFINTLPQTSKQHGLNIF